jgi:hypothetical protein
MSHSNRARTRNVFSSLSIPSTTPTFEPVTVNTQDSASELCKKLNLTYYDVDALNPFNKPPKRFVRNVIRDGEEAKKQKQQKTLEKEKNLQQPSVRLNLSKTVDASKCDILTAQELRDLVADEFAAKYLEELGITPTAQNVENIMKKFPLDRCGVERRRGDSGTYLHITPNMIRPEQKATQIVRNTTSLDIFDDSLLNKVTTTMVTESGITIEPTSSTTSNTTNNGNTLVDILNTIKPQDKAKESRLSKIPLFDEYSKRYVYPYNLMSKFRSNSDIQQDILTSIITDKSMLRHRSTMTIYEIMQKDRELERSYFPPVESTPVQNKTSGNSGTSGSSTSTGYRRKSKSIATFDRSSHSIRNRSKSQGALNTERRGSVISNGGSSPYGPSRLDNQTSLSRTSSVSNSSSKHQPVDSVIYTTNNILKNRFSGVFNGNSSNGSSPDIKDGAYNTISNAMNATHRLLDLELSKPPFLAKSEIMDLQAKFLGDFPFHIWSSDHLSTSQKEQLHSSICSMKLTGFIRNFAEFSYWTFLGDCASEEETQKHLNNSMESDEDFLKVYSDIIELMKTHRKAKRTLVVDLPITLLCIRVVTETIFKICYQNWWQTPYSEILAQRMDKLVSFLFDPEDYLSHLAPVESNVKERKMANRMNRMSQNNVSLIRNRTSKMYSMSPVVKFVLHDANSFGARNMIRQGGGQQQAKTQESIPVEEDKFSENDLEDFSRSTPTLNDISRALKPAMRAKLLDIYMRKF